MITPKFKDGVINSEINKRQRSCCFKTEISIIEDDFNIIIAIRLLSHIFEVASHIPDVERPSATH